MKRLLVLSGINIVEGGALTVYFDFLRALMSSYRTKKFEIVAFVHKKALFQEFADQIILVEKPNAKKNYIFRMWYEYYYFRKYSSINDVDIWISLHDTTPSVKTRKLLTYCHNPTPFLKGTAHLMRYSPKVFLFSIFYRYLYQINIHKNSYVIVQQDWIRKQFSCMYSLDQARIVVAKPVFTSQSQADYAANKDLYENVKCGVHSYIFPAFPRVFKNFELICKACEEISRSTAGLDIEVFLTMDGTENSYARMIYDKYKDNSMLKFIGLQPKEELLKYYESVDCLIFPSKLETWGLPISEFKAIGKPIMLADLPYAHETLGNYDRACFFNPESASDLADKMKMAAMSGNCFIPHKTSTPLEPFCENWESFVDFLLED